MQDTSQYEQAKILIKLFGGEDNIKAFPKFALEVGAFDGVTNSNVKPFFDLGWNGICVEPDPISFTKVYALHFNNPKVNVFNICIHDKSPSLVDFYGVSERLQYNDRQLSSLSKKFSDDINSTRSATAKVTKKLALNLNDFYNSFVNQYVTYLSIDCECYDEKIILATNFEKFRPKVIQAEFQYDDKIKNEKMFDKACNHLVKSVYTVYRFKEGSDILAIDTSQIKSLDTNVLSELTFLKC